MMNRRTAQLNLLVVLLVSVWLVSCSGFLPEKYAASFQQNRCLPSFPDQDGWYGGDGAYSVSLDDQRTLWLFGDTFVSGDHHRKDRVNMDVILGTTMAISTCSPAGDFAIRYYLQKKNGKYVSSFGEDEWLWPQDPFIVNDVLYVPLITVTPGDREGELFNFSITGHKFARITDYSAADPRLWKYDPIDFTSAIPKEISAFAATSVVHDGYVYFFPLYVSLRDNESVLGNILARIPVGRIDNPVNAIEYLMKDGTWQTELSPANVNVVLEALASELSVRYHHFCGKWIAVYLSVHHKGDQLLYQFADRLEGPWSKPRPLGGKIPEVDPGSAHYDENNFCYAGKEHVDFSRGSGVVVSYVCNSFEDPEKQDSFIRRNMHLYRPVVSTFNYCE